MFSLIIYSAANVLYGKRIKQIFSSFLYNRSLNQLIRDGNLLNESVSFFLYLNYFIVLGILFYEVCKLKLNQNIIPHSGILLYFIIEVLIILFFALKSGLITLIGVIFKTKKETNSYLLFLYIFNQASGIILLPLMIIITYLRIYFLFYIILAIFVLILFYRLLRIMINRISPSNFSVFYIFLYLCTIEFIPLLIFIKLIYNHLI